MDYSKVGKLWETSDGSKRWYIGYWKCLVNIDIQKDSDGRILSASYNGESCSVEYYEKYILSTKVYITENGEIHVDKCGDGELIQDIKTAVQKEIQKKYRGVL